MFCSLKPVYVKDEFFDSLSCTTLDRGTRNGRTKFSEQLKIDSEVSVSPLSGLHVGVSMKGVL